MMTQLISSTTSHQANKSLITILNDTILIVWSQNIHKLLNAIYFRTSGMKPVNVDSVDKNTDPKSSGLFKVQSQYLNDISTQY
jgi:hypothetical protein